MGERGRDGLDGDGLDGDGLDGDGLDGDGERGWNNNTGFYPPK